MPSAVRLMGSLPGDSKESSLIEHRSFPEISIRLIFGAEMVMAPVLLLAVPMLANRHLPKSNFLLIGSTSPARQMRGVWEIKTNSAPGLGNFPEREAS